MKRRSALEGSGTDADVTTRIQFECIKSLGEEIIITPNESHMLEYTRTGQIHAPKIAPAATIILLIQ